jgi:hypothetical protein
MLGRHTHECTAVVDEIDDAPVCDLRHGQTSDAFQRFLRVQRFGENTARLTKEAVSSFRGCTLFVHLILAVRFEPLSH